MTEKLSDLIKPTANAADDEGLSEEEEAVLGVLGESDESSGNDDISDEEAALIEAALDSSSGDDAVEEEEDLSAEEAALIEAALKESSEDDGPVEISDDDLLGEPSALVESDSGDDIGDSLPDIDDNLLGLDPEGAMEPAPETLPPPPPLKTPRPRAMPGEAAAEISGRRASPAAKAEGRGFVLDAKPTTAKADAGRSSGLDAKPAAARPEGRGFVLDAKPTTAKADAGRGLGLDAKPAAAKADAGRGPGLDAKPAAAKADPARGAGLDAKVETRPGEGEEDAGDDGGTSDDQRTPIPTGAAGTTPPTEAPEDDEPFDDFEPYEGAPAADALEVSDQLIEQIDDIVARREHTLGLLGNAESKKEQVKPDIFKRVVGDYQKQLRAIEAEYEPVSRQICQEITEISRREVELRGERENVNDVMVEMRFRCEVGEFSDEDLFPIEAENSRKLKALNSRLSVVERTYMTCQKYLRQEDFDAAVRRGASDDAAGPPEPPPDEVDIDIFDQADEPAVFGGEVRGEPLVTDPGEFADAVTPPEPMQPAAEYQAWRAEGASEAPTMAVPAKEAHGSDRVRCYIVLKTPAGGEEPHALGLDAFAIGRHPKNDLVLSDRGISRRHARVVLESSGRYSITDLSSGNGIFVNGERVSGTAELNNGDHIVMGNCQLCYLERLD